MRLSTFSALRRDLEQVSPQMCSILALRHIDKAKTNRRQLVSDFSEPLLKQHEFWNSFTRSKSREEIELQQGTPEVQKYLQNWQCAANENNQYQKCTNQRRRFEEFSSGSSVNFRSARYRGAITVFTYVCGTMEVHKQGTPEVHFTSRRCNTYVHGTPAI